MMLWQWQTKKVGSQKIMGACTYCGAEKLFLVELRQVGHFLGIPTPIKDSEKHALVECSACKAEFTCQDYGVSSFESIRSPWWAFSGACIIGCFIFFLNSISSSDAQKIEAFKKDPRVGSYFTIKNKGDDREATLYLFAKIKRITPTMIQFYISKDTYTSDYKAREQAKISQTNPSSSESDIIQVTRREFTNMDIQSVVT